MRVALGIVAVSLGVKLAALVAMGSQEALVTKDFSASYRPMALELLAGKGFVLKGSEAEAGRIPPVFPAFLAGVYSGFGVDCPLWVLGALNAVFRSLTSGLVYVLGSGLVGQRAAVVAATVHALDPWEAFWVGFAGKDSLAILLFVGACVAIQRGLDSEGLGAALTAGLAVGVASLTRYASLGLLPCGLFVVVAQATRDPSQRRRAAGKCLAIAAGTLIALVPWLVRNQRVYGQPILTPHFVGRYLYVSNGPGVESQAIQRGYATAHPAGDYTATVERMPGTPVEKEWAFLGGAIHHVTAHPVAVARVLAAKFVSTWRPTFEGASARNWLILGLPYCVFMGLALAGLARALVASKPMTLPLTLLALFGLLHVLLLADIRFRAYLTPLLALFVGLALERLLWRGAR
jgi:hypothetical protein